MPDQHNRRKWERQTLDPPELGYLLSEDLEYKSGTVAFMSVVNEI